jgi:D-amino-acid dehydrogenase
MELSGINRRVHLERVQRLTEAARAYFPEFRAEDFRDAPAWIGLRPCSPDGLPYIGRFARHPNLCAATGHAMMGVGLAPITGFLVSQILSGEEPLLPIETLTPERYA